MDTIYLVLTFLSFSKIAVTDYREYSIYDRDILLTICIILAYKFYIGAFFSALLGTLAGFICGLIIFTGAYLVYKAETFGFGDVLLLGVIGAYFGWPVFMSYFTVSIVCTGFISAFLLIIFKKLRHAYVPIGPILVFWIYLYEIIGCPSIESAFYNFFYYFFFFFYKIIYYFAS